MLLADSPPASTIFELLPMVIDPRSFQDQLIAEPPLGTRLAELAREIEGVSRTINPPGTPVIIVILLFEIKLAAKTYCTRVQAPNRLRCYRPSSKDRRQ